jgi:hypothetical protein
MYIRGGVSSEGAGEVVVGKRLCMSVALILYDTAIIWSCTIDKTVLVVQDGRTG